MKIADLVAQGATVCGGGVDYKNKYIGRLMSDGTVLCTPEGEELAKSILAISDAVIVNEPARAAPKAPLHMPQPRRAKVQVNDDLGLDDL